MAAMSYCALAFDREERIAEIIEEMMDEGGEFYPYKPDLFFEASGDIDMSIIVDHFQKGQYEEGGRLFHDLVVERIFYMAEKAAMKQAIDEENLYEESLCDR